MVKKDEGKIAKFGISLFIANMIRLLKFIPNNDPIMAMALPFSKQEKWYYAVLFPLLTMVSFDIITGFVGSWTIVTSLTYAAIGGFFYWFYRKAKKISILTYVGSGIAGVLFFDLVTGVIATPLMFPGMTFEQAFLGQIPFTLYHLVTTVCYIFIITPVLDKHVVSNPQLSDSKIVDILKAKARV